MARDEKEREVVVSESTTEIFNKGSNGVLLEKLGFYPEPFIHEGPLSSGVLWKI